jgi:hypothetical protein
VNYEAGRNANQKDFDAVLNLPERPGMTSIGPRSLAFCHPGHSRTALTPYFQSFPEGIFLSEEAGQITGFACAIRTSKQRIDTAHTWFQATSEGSGLSHLEDGQWLYVARFAYTAGPGHAPLLSELAPILIALQNLAASLDLEGVAFPTRFPGFRERFDPTAFQRSCIENPQDQVRSAMNPIGVAYYLGFRHRIALPKYLGDMKNFALMVWRRNGCRSLQ